MSAFAIVLVVTGVLNVLLIAIGPAFVGYGVALLILGRRDPHVPCCTRCHAAITRETLASSAACPACGSTPLATAALRSSARTRAILFIVLPIVGWLALAFLVAAAVAAGSGVAL